MIKVAQTAGVLGLVMVAVAGCVPQSDPASRAPTATPESNFDAGRRLQADDPRAGTNTNRPDSPKDIEPEPGTPTPEP